MQNFKQKQKKRLRQTQILLVIGILLLILSPFLFTQNLGFDFSNTGQIGDTIGGITSPIASLIGAFLVYYAFLVQLDANQLIFKQLNEEKKDRDKSQVESRFFELLKIHIEDEKDMKINNEDFSLIIQGKEIFFWMIKEFYECYNIIEKFYEKNDDENKISITEKINIAYTCFFYGVVGEHSINIVSEHLKNADPLLLKWIKLNFPKRKKIIAKKFPYKLFNGHHARLGHYYNHLYQTVKYINQQPKNILSYKEKYDYIKILRAQLNTNEQTMLFFTSLSTVGIKWEKGQFLDENKKLITKYNLIKNIPREYIAITKVENHYPHINWDPSVGNTEEKKKLIEIYN